MFQESKPFFQIEERFKRSHPLSDQRAAGISNIRRHSVNSAGSGPRILWVNSKGIKVEMFEEGDYYKQANTPRIFLHVHAVTIKEAIIRTNDVLQDNTVYSPANTSVYYLGPEDSEHGWLVLVERNRTRWIFQLSSPFSN